MWDILSNVASGGLFGLVGAGVTKFMDYKTTKLKLAHEVVMASEERESMKMEVELAKVKGKIELEVETTKGDALSLQAAVLAESTITGCRQWVTGLKGATRPVLTFLLCFAAVLVILVAPGNPHTKQIIFLASVAVTFWFGSRPAKTN